MIHVKAMSFMVRLRVNFLFIGNAMAIYLLAAIITRLKADTTGEISATKWLSLHKTVPKAPSTSHSRGRKVIETNFMGSATQGIIKSDMAMLIIK